MAVLCASVSFSFAPFHKLVLSSSIQLQNFHSQCHYPRHCLRIAASRNVKKSKRDADIRNEIRKFLSSVGLPENHVPSMKELSQNGRKDLANLVRRRGYKYVRQLLDESNTENMDTNQNGKLEELGGSEGQNENVRVSSDDASTIQEAEYDYGVRTDDKGVELNDQSSLVAELTTLSLQEKVAKFVECGELDTIEDFGLQIGRANKGEWNSKSEHSSNDPQEKDISVSVSSDETLYENGPLSLQRIEHLPFENNSRDPHLSPIEPTNDDNDLGTEKSENQAEIDRLKSLLRQKEMELNKLKQQIEEEKLSLSVLQTKAEREISDAQKLISEKDSELEEAEKRLSLLQEVEILYSGDAKTVEFSGSFNGWHETITMDLQTPNESSTAKLWRAVLWLYPGVYEMKFIVDGEWRIDPQQESITRGSLQNNILRVRMMDSSIIP